MTTWGIFSDEGQLEGDFASREDAEAVLLSDYAEDDAHVEECCADHPDQPKFGCEKCEDAESDEDEDEDEDEE